MTSNGRLERLNGRDWRLILAAICIAAASLWVASRYFHRAFPEAAIDFRVSATGSTPIAQAFLQQRGLSTAGFTQAEQFNYDDNAKTFLERELGLERAEALQQGRIHLWRWQNRWFRPLSKEEFRVDVAPSGEVVSFEHLIPDEADGANLEQANAQVLAEQFLTGGMRQDLAGLQLVQSQRTVRAHRTDYVFAWKEAAPLAEGASGDVAQAEYRHQVTVQGDTVGGYGEYLKVPDQWERDYRRLRSKNDTASEIDTALFVLLVLGALVAMTRRIRSRDVRWRPTFWVGGTGAVLSFLSDLNSWSASRFDYPTTQSWNAFVASGIFGAVVSALAVGVGLGLLTAAAEPLYREGFPRQISVSSWLSRSGWRTKGFFVSVILGLALAAFFFAYQTIFYLVANHFGAWAPSDINYDEILNTRIPWAYVLFGGFFPAVSEEFGFRMLAIPLFKKLFRWMPVAVVVASYMWGFGHAGYPNEPFYIRAVEVGTGGVLLSYVMIQYGILTTVVWHYTVDAVYTAMLLLRAHDAYLRVSGGLTAFIAVVPLLIAAAAYLKTGGFAPSRGLANGDEGSAPELPPETQEQIAAPEYRPVEAKKWSLGLLIGGVLLAAYAVPLRSWSNALPWKISKAEAVGSSQRFLLHQGVKLDGYRAAPETASPDELGNGLGEQNEVAAAEIFAQRGRAALILAFSGSPPTVPAMYWRVRWFRPLQEEEYSVAVRADTGEISGYSHLLPESAPGASPSMAQAQQRASDFLTQRGIPVSGMQMKMAFQEHRAARVDSDFTWEQVSGSPLPGVAAYRVEAQLAGDTVSGFHAWYYVPEAEVRLWVQKTLRATVMQVFFYLAWGSAFGMVLWLFFGFTRRAQLPWGRVVMASLAACALVAIAFANRIPEFLQSYDTSRPWKFWVVQTVIELVASLVGVFLLTAALTAPTMVTAPRQVTALFQKSGLRQWAEDALWVGVLATMWTFGWGRAHSVIGSYWRHAGATPMPSPPSMLTDSIPGLTELGMMPVLCLWEVAFLALLLPVLRRWWRAREPRGKAAAVVAVILFGVLQVSEVHTGTQLAWAVIAAALATVLVFTFATVFLRDNPLAYISAVLLPLLISNCVNWFSITGTPTPHYGVVAGLIYLALAALWLLWLASLARLHKQQP